MAKKPKLTTQEKLQSLLDHVRREHPERFEHVTVEELWASACKGRSDKQAIATVNAMYNSRKLLEQAELTLVGLKALSLQATETGPDSPPIQPR